MARSRRAAHRLPSFRAAAACAAAALPLVRKDALPEHADLRRHRLRARAELPRAARSPRCQYDEPRQRRALAHRRARPRDRAAAPPPSRRRSTRSPARYGLTRRSIFRILGEDSARSVQRGARARQGRSSDAVPRNRRSAEEADMVTTTHAHDNDDPPRTAPPHGRRPPARATPRTSRSTAATSGRHR